MPTFEEQRGGPPTGPTVRRLILGTQLRRLRERAGITRAEASYSIRGSESKLSRMESGRVGFKQRDVVDLLTLYGVADQQERAKVIELVAQSNVQGWWHAYSDLMPRWFEDYVGLEECASQIKVYELQFVPGLFQTEDYALAILSRGRPENADTDAERKLRLRMQRQKILLGQSAPKVWVVIDESVLYRRLGGPKVLREQLDHLLEVTALPNISLQVVPYHTSGYGAEGPFTLLRFSEPELSDIVYVEHLAGALYLEKPEEVETYSRALDRLAVEAETPARSRQILLKAREDI
jgi:transcriptional regulator with XRE-family HTH domain